MHDIIVCKLFLNFKTSNTQNIRKFNIFTTLISHKDNFFKYHIVYKFFELINNTCIIFLLL